MLGQSTLCFKLVVATIPAVEASAHHFGVLLRILLQWAFFEEMWAQKDGSCRACIAVRLASAILSRLVSRLKMWRGAKDLLIGHGISECASILQSQGSLVSIHWHGSKIVGPCAGSGRLNEIEPARIWTNRPKMHVGSRE